MNGRIYFSFPSFLGAEVYVKVLFCFQRFFRLSFHFELVRSLSMTKQRNNLSQRKSTSFRNSYKVPLHQFNCDDEVCAKFL
jgi:hypothetical protein